jgi:hypothetical protein
MSENLVNTAVPVTLDGQDYILRYRALAFIKYADECKGDLLHDIRRIGGALAEYGKLAAAGDDGPAAGSIATLAPILVTIRDVLWAGLIDAQPMIQREEVGSMFGLNDFPVLVPVITNAVMRGLPTADPVRPTKPARAAGRSSRLTNGAGSGPVVESRAESVTPNSAGSHSASSVG